MARANPRSVILTALQEGPRDWHDLRLALDNDFAAIGKNVHQQIRRWGEADRLVDRHLCHLIRSRKAARLKDGRYVFRKGRFIWPGAKGAGTVDVIITQAAGRSPIETRSEAGKLTLSCCGHTIENGSGQPDGIARPWLERALAEAGCTHVPADVLGQFRRDRDAGYYVREFGAVEEWLRPQATTEAGDDR